MARNWPPSTVVSSISNGRRVESAGPIIIRSLLARTCARSAAWPHHQVAMLGRISGSPSSAWAMRGRKASSARVSRTPEPSALTRVTRALAQRADEAGRAEARGGVELERVGEGGVEAAPEHADRAEAGDGAHHDPAVLDGQVLALEQHEAEVAGDVGVLEVGVVERARGQDGDAGVGLVGEALQRVAEGAEEAGEAVDVRLGVEVGEDARGGDAVLQREAGAGGRLGAVAEHPPGAVGAAADLEGDEVQVVAAARRRRRPAGAATRGCRRSGGRAGGRRRPGGSGRRGRRRRASSRSARWTRPRAMRAPSSSSIRTGMWASGQARSLGPAVPYWRKKTPASRRYWSPRAKRRARSSGVEAGEVVDEVRARPGGCRPAGRAARRRRRAAGGSRRAGARPGRRRGARSMRASMLRSRAPGAGRGSSGTRGAGASAGGHVARRRCGRAARSGRGGGPRPRCR